MKYPTKEEVIMSIDTEREVEKILANGFYPQNQVMGDGGWGFLHSKGANEWGKYILWGDAPEEVETITAKDDETAIKAFSSMYRLDMFGRYEISEKIVTFRTVVEAMK